MITEFRRAIVPDEIRSLMAFDRRIFPKSDRFDAAYWNLCEPYWMVVDGVRAGCCAFERHVDFQDDMSRDGLNRRRRGSLYICTTGILPRFQGNGFGSLLKSWEVAFARYHGFKRMVTNTRSRNTRMIALNRKFGFRVVRTTARYYSDPVDSTVVMELIL